MIRALLGRFVLHCIDLAEKRRFDKETRGLDFDALSNGQISDLLHGRPIDVSRARAERPHHAQSLRGTVV